MTHNDEQLFERLYRDKWSLEKRAGQQIAIGWAVAGSAVSIAAAVLDPQLTRQISLQAVGGVILASALFLLFGGIAIAMLSAVMVSRQVRNGIFDLVRITTISEWRIIYGYHHEIERRAHFFHMLIAGSAVSLWASVSVVGMWVLGPKPFSARAGVWQLALTLLVSLVPLVGIYVASNELAKLGQHIGLAIGLQEVRTERAALRAAGTVSLWLAGFLILQLATLTIPCCWTFIPFMAAFVYGVRQRVELQKTLITYEPSS